MAKKPVNRKNSRAARRSSEGNSSLDVGTATVEGDAKSRILQQLAERELRKGAKRSSKSSELDEELTAITEGTHPDQLTNSAASIAGQASKAPKKNKKAKKKQERAEMLKDILNEKIDLAKKRHKTVRNYRNPDEDEE